MAGNKILTYSELIDDYNQNHLKNLYLFFGKEDFLKENILKRIKENFGDDTSQELNYKTFYGDKIKVSEIIEELQSTSIFYTQKTVVLKKIGKLSKISLEKLLSFLETWEQKTDSVRLYLVYDDEKPDKKLLDLVNEKGNSVNFEKVNKNIIDKWIKSRFKRSGKMIDDDTIFYLKSMTDTNLRKIFIEIEKIDVFTHGKKVINKEDLTKALGNSESVNIFSMLDNMGEKKMKEAMEGMIKLNTGNLHYLSILSMIHRQIKLIFQMKALREKNKDFNFIRKKLKLPEFIIKKIKSQSKKYTFDQLFHAYNLIMLADIELKESGKEPAIILEELVYNIISGNSEIS